MAANSEQEEDTQKKMQRLTDTELSLGERIRPAEDLEITSLVPITEEVRNLDAELRQCKETTVKNTNAFIARIVKLQEKLMSTEATHETMVRMQTFLMERLRGIRARIERGFFSAVVAEGKGPAVAVNIDEEHLIVGNVAFIANFEVILNKLERVEFVDQANKAQKEHFIASVNEQKNRSAMSLQRIYEMFD